MSRQSQFKTGGGFLKGVDGTITGYTFTDEFNGQPFVPAKVKDARTGKTKDRFHSLYFVPSIRVDGAAEDITIHLFGGNYEAFEVSEDGRTLTPLEDGYQLGVNNAVAKFIQTWEAASGTGASSDDESVIDFTPIIGSRCRFDQALEVGRDGQPMKRKAKTGKYAGREFDLTTTVVEQVYELAQPATKGGNGKSAKPAAGKAAVAARPTTRTVTTPSNSNSSTTTTSRPEPAEEDIKDLSGRALVEILEANNNSIAKQKLSVRTLTTPVLKGNPQREDARKWLFNDDNLADLVEDGLITYEKSKGMIELVTT